MRSKQMHGLILAGGASKRMQKDKTNIDYHGMSQSSYCYVLMQEFCDYVYLSVRPDQSDREGYKGFEQIHDVPPFKDIGPLGGILSAMTQYPDRLWLVLAIDLPFVNKHTLSELINYRNPQKIATAYRSVHDGLPEPLCAIYEPHAMGVLRSFYDEGIYCPRKILSLADAELITLNEEQALDNVNTLEEYTQAKNDLKRYKPKHGPKEEN